MPTTLPAPIEVINIPDVFIAQQVNYGWNVILHNDDTVAAETVILALMTVLRYDENTSGAIMWEAHTHGSASVIITTEELAKEYQAQLQIYGLTITIEKL